MLTLDPVRKHSFRHNNGIYALAWHVVGPDGENPVKRAMLLWVTDIEWLPEEEGIMQGREAWGFGVSRTRVQIPTLLPSSCMALGGSPTLGAVLWGAAQC